MKLVMSFLFINKMEGMTEQRDNIFSEICPNCKGRMAKGNKFCKIACYNEFNQNER